MTFTFFKNYNPVSYNCMQIFDNKLYGLKNFKLCQIDRNGSIKKEFEISTYYFLITDLIFGTAMRNYNIIVWEGNKKITELVGHCGKITSFFYHNHKLYSCGCDKKLIIWDTKSFQILQSIEYPERVYNLKVIDSKTYVVLENNLINVYDTETFDFIYKIETGTTNNFIGFTGSMLVTVSYTPNFHNSISIWNKDNGKEISNLKKNDRRFSSVYLHDNILYLGVELRHSNRLIAIDINSFTKIFEFKLKSSVNSLCVFKDRLFVDNEHIHIWDIHTRFTPELELFRKLNSKTKKILWVLSLVRERLDQREYGLPPELWFCILYFTKTYELTY